MDFFHYIPSYIWVIILLVSAVTIAFGNLSSSDRHPRFHKYRRWFLGLGTVFVVLWNIGLVIAREHEKTYMLGKKSHGLLISEVHKNIKIASEMEETLEKHSLLSYSFQTAAWEMATKGGPLTDGLLAHIDYATLLQINSVYSLITLTNKQHAQQLALPRHSGGGLLSGDHRKRNIQDIKALIEKLTPGLKNLSRNLDP